MQKSNPLELIFFCLTSPPLIRKIGEFTKGVVIVKCSGVSGRFKLID